MLGMKHGHAMYDNSFGISDSIYYREVVSECGSQKEQGNREEKRRR